VIIPRVARILINTFGSLGDVHPYIALARGLIARGHGVTIATSAGYGSRIERTGVAFHPVRPDLEDFGPIAEVARRVYDPRAGSEYIIRHLLLPRLADTFDDLQAAVPGTDLLLTHALSYAGHLLARSRRIPWLSTILSPMVFLSAYDPPILPPAPWLQSLFRLSPPVYRGVFRALKATTRSWSQPIRDLVRARGLPPQEEDPLFEGQFSPYGTLAMFSSLMAVAQRDWPAHTHITGFAMHDEGEPSGIARERLHAFLAAGPAPLVFTLGSSAIYDARDFYRDSVQIAQRLGRRALLLTGDVPENARLPELPADILAVDYVPYSEVFAHAAAIVHQGGIGTLAQGLHAGRPMLVVPFSHDQPDNAERAQRLGVARTLRRARFSVQSACAQIEVLLSEQRYVDACRRVQQALRKEDGVGAACDRIEQVLTSRERAVIAPPRELNPASGAQWRL
jgi:rhamnosyltransferase subunit B